MLRQLRVQNFRNHIDGSFKISPHSTLIVGKNGTGKTSLLEAVYINYRGSSFKGSDSDIVRENTEWYRIDVTDSEYNRTVRYAKNEQGHMKKSFEVDEKKSIRLPHKYKRTVVLFSPDDLQLLSGSPARRRKYIDTLLSQIDPRYSTILRRYEQALLQRNRLLKSARCTPDTIFPWNVLLSEHGSYIISARVDMIEKINTFLSEKYNLIATKADSLEISYTHTRHTSHYLLAEYEASYDRDRILGTTGYGPHRHDLIVSMNNKVARDVASRGENRSIILALKSIEANLLAELFEYPPLILLDDVYGELDNERQQKLISIFSDYQIIITSVHEIEGDYLRINL